MFDDIKKFIAVGDVHGKYSQVHKICAENPDTLHINVGDMCIYHNLNEGLPKNFRFFRGNHDNPMCVNHPNYAKEYGIYIPGVYIVAGASSIDSLDRTPGIDYWANEQLDRETMELVLEDYSKCKPDIVMTHEAPFVLHKIQHAASLVYNPRNRFGIPRGNSTAFLLDNLLKIHVPKLWIHGHWHNRLIYKQWGCTFVSLGELETYEVNL